jgi:hypothetical protein
LPIGELPGTAFIELRTSDLLTHAWDLAIATGQPTDLDPELAEYVLAFSKQMMNRPGSAVMVVHSVRSGPAATSAQRRTESRLSSAAS